VKFRIIGAIYAVETIASGHGIDVLAQLTRRFGRGNWRKMKGIAFVRYANGLVREVELHWHEAHGIGKRLAKGQAHIQTMSDRKHFVICIENGDGEYDGAIDIRRIYETVEPESNDPEELIRVIDEQGEDYLYPREWFLPIELPDNVAAAIVQLVPR
jgi:hypothetical protein